MSQTYVRHFSSPPARGRVWPPLALTLTCLVLLALLLRVTIRDRVLILATVYYAIPLPVGGLLSLAAAAIWGRRRRRAWAGALLALAALHGGWMFVRAPRGQAQTPIAATSPRLRILLWNASSAAFGLRHIETFVRESQADVAAFVEARRPGEWMDNWWKTTFPDYQYHAFADGMVVLSRIDGIAAKLEPMGDLGRRATLRLRTAGGREFTFALIDIQHYVFSSRGGALRALDAWVGEQPDTPLIVAGDFNTPPDSAHFDPLRARLRNGWELAGAGYSPTWPAPLPVLTLDQLWVSPGVRVVSIGKRSTIVSDHLPLIAEIALEERDVSTPARSNALNPSAAPQTR